MGSGGARHVVFGRFAAEQHHEMNALTGVPRGGHRPTVPSAPVRIRASEAAAGIGGRLIGPDVEFEGASFDSRSTQPGQLFVPIVAERNGHEFIGAARERGATVHLTSEPDPFRRDGTAIEVADTAQALLALAQWARPRLDRQRGRGDRQRRQDVGEGPDGRRLQCGPAHHGERAELQQRAGSPRHDPQRARRHRGADPRDGHARVRSHQPTVRDRPSRHRRGHRRRACAHRDGRRHRRRRTRQGRTRRGAAGDRDSGPQRRRRTGGGDAITYPCRRGHLREPRRRASE